MICEEAKKVKAELFKQYATSLKVVCKDWANRNGMQ